MQSKATTVDQYLASLPEDRRAAIWVELTPEVVWHSTPMGLEQT
jgi:hypothetical protein